MKRSRKTSPPESATRRKGQSTGADACAEQRTTVLGLQQQA